MYIYGFVNIYVGLFVLAVIVEVACDPVQQVVTTNTTDAPVMIYYGDRSATSTGMRLEPGATDRTAGMVGSISKTVRAYDAEDNLIFCRAYSNRDLERGILRIDIRRNEVSC
jgi:hypothetical protein